MYRTMHVRRWSALAPTVFAVLALLSALAIALLRPAPAGAQEVVVDISDFTFLPGSLEIEAGTTVTWVNNDSAPHTATGDGGEFDTGTINSGGSGSITFSTPGTYAYHCEIHPNMTAVIVVVGADAAGADAGDDTGAGATTSSNLPSTGVGAALGSGSNGALVVSLLIVAGAFALAGLALRRRPLTP